MDQPPETELPLLGDDLDEPIDDWLEELHERLPVGLPRWGINLVVELRAALDHADRGGDPVDVAIRAIVAAAGAATLPRRALEQVDWRTGFLSLLAHDLVREYRETGRSEIATARESLAFDLELLGERLAEWSGGDLDNRRRLSAHSQSLLRVASIVILDDIIDNESQPVTEPVPDHDPDYGTPTLTAAQLNSLYRAYEREAIERYTTFFAVNPALRDPDHPYKAVSLEAALPQGWGGLAEYLPRAERHRHHLSGRSSQVLALGLLGSGIQLEPDLGWLAEALDMPSISTGSEPTGTFEWRAPFELLNEQPRPTSVDLLVENEGLSLCIEAKWTERGFGTCSCTSEARLSGDCQTRVRARTAYWQVLGQDFGRPLRLDGTLCPLSALYQQVRNVAVARALAERGGRKAAVAVLYDDRNPAFSDARGDDGGLPALRHALADSPVELRTVSWQRLMEHLPDDTAVRAWAEQRHGL